MKFEITVFSNVPNTVLVKNTSDKDYCYKRGVQLCVAKGDQVTAPIHVVKHLLGDWDKDGEYAEMLRRREKNIDLFDLKIIHLEKKVSSDVETAAEIIISAESESEFDDLKPVATQCAGKTKAGKPCQKLSVPGQKFCPLHKE